MTDDDDLYKTDGGHPSWGANPRIRKTPNAEANKIAEKGNPVPSSTELIAMANQEWKNREERRGIHNREDWCCGWMAGFLSEKKPNWRKEQIGAAEKRGYERALDDLGVLHGGDAREDEQRKWRDDHPADLVWMTPEEEEARIRGDERERLRVVTESPLFWSIGRIEGAMRDNAVIRSELDGVLPHLYSISESLRSEAKKP